jgi:hypothetical protein
MHAPQPFGLHETQKVFSKQITVLIERTCAPRPARASANTASVASLFEKIGYFLSGLGDFHNLLCFFREFCQNGFLLTDTDDL